MERIHPKVGHSLLRAGLLAEGFYHFTAERRNVLWLAARNELAIDDNLLVNPPGYLRRTCAEIP
jgi:hypothetical protein